MKRLAKPSIQIQTSFLSLFALEKQGEVILKKESFPVGTVTRERGLSYLTFDCGRYLVDAQSQKENGAYQMVFSMREKARGWNQIYGTYYISRTQPLRTSLSYIRFCDGIVQTEVSMNRDNQLLKIEGSDRSIQVSQEQQSFSITHVVDRQKKLNATVDTKEKSVVIHQSLGAGIKGHWFEEQGMLFLRKKMFELDRSFYQMIFEEQSPFWIGEDNFFWNAVDSCYDTKQEDFKNLVFNQKQIRKSREKK